MRVQRLVNSQNLLLAETDVALTKSTADCGCKSALLSYRSFERKGRGFDRQLAKGTFVSFRFGPQPQRFVFVVKPDASYNHQGALVLTIGCEAPG